MKYTVVISKEYAGMAFVPCFDLKTANKLADKNRQLGYDVELLKNQSKKVK